MAAFFGLKLEASFAGWQGAVPQGIKFIIYFNTKIAEYLQLRGFPSDLLTRGSAPEPNWAGSPTEGGRGRREEVGSKGKRGGMEGEREGRGGNMKGRERQGKRKRKG